MAGGLLNLVAYGNQNIIINGNPDKSFFKIKYLKHTNFGMQKFRVDHKQTNNAQLVSDSTFTFTIPRYADLLMNVFLVFKLPKIWSPIFIFWVLFYWGTCYVAYISIPCGVSENTPITKSTF